MKSVRYVADYLSASRSWRVILVDLNIQEEDDDLNCALWKARASAASELSLKEHKVKLVPAYKGRATEG